MGLLLQSLASLSSGSVTNGRYWSRMGGYGALGDKKEKVDSDLLAEIPTSFMSYLKIYKD